MIICENTIYLKDIVANVCVLVGAGKGEIEKVNRYRNIVKPVTG